MKKKRLTIGLAMVALGFTLALATAQTLSPSSLLETNTTTPSKTGTAKAFHVTVQSWGIVGRDHPTHEIPLRGFYVAHLLSGHISATTSGQTTEPLPGSYWTVKDGATMLIKVLGEVAVLETIVVAE
jgi:hypothetical protein